MSFREISEDTSTENGDSNFSNTDALIFGSADISGGDTSMISGPNTASSSSSSYWSVDHHHQQISTAAGGCDDDNELIVSSASSRILNDDFRAFTSVAGSELGLRLNTGDAEGVNNETSNMLVQISIACFEAIQQNNLNLADTLVTDLRKFADSQIGDMKKVATDFAQALDQMIIHGTNIPQSIHQNPKLRSLKLMFLRKVYVPVFTGKEIKRVGGSTFDVALVDVNSGEIVDSAPEASVTVEIVVLRGDFGGDGRDNWTSEEFDSNIVRHREDVNKPLFSGTVHIRLNRGIGLIDKINFSHYTNYMKTNVFCLGARVIECFDGTRLKEAKTEPFTVKDARVAAM
uniref:Calmodulin binding protein n=2 Tax=Solanum tuberosum TaxID=4113 RepID=M1B5Y2_SOLTU